MPDPVGPRASDAHAATVTSSSVGAVPLVLAVVLVLRSRRGLYGGSDEGTLIG